jgi:hypothetical protein
MEPIPQRRAYQIIVRLRAQPQYCQDDLERLKGALPRCTKAVWFDDKVIGLFTASEYGPQEILQHYGRVLRPFTQVNVLELGRLSASTYGTHDPIDFWMEVNVRRGERRQSDEAEDMLKKKWGQRRVESTEYGSVADAIRKVFSGTRPRDDGAKKDGKPD